ncbi:MAG: peptide-methionine (S)-S-oxide reductase [Candidatus Lokiarchaeota archaeon]
MVTQVEPFNRFYKAEEYHKQYFSRNPNAGYCRVVIAPKIAKLRKKYREKLKK